MGGNNTMTFHYFVLVVDSCSAIGGIPPGKSDASGGIGPKNLILK